MSGAKQSRTRQLGMCLALVLVVVSLVVVRGSTLVVPMPIADINEDRLETGDILFVDIYNGWSQGGYWDHMAVYLEDPYPGVVEATYDAGISYTPLRAFVERDLPAEVSVRRLKEIPDRDEVVRLAVEYAMAQVGRPFDYMATATLPLKINEGNLHCSEVVWRSYRAAGIDLDSNGGIMVYPDDIYFSPKLEVP